MLSGRLNPDLQAQADRTRSHFCGEKVIVRGLFEFSNYCARSCLYCGLRKDNPAVRRYRIEPREIFRLAGAAAGKGFETIVLQSGDDLYYSRPAICALIKKIKDKYPDLALTLSIGERPRDDYRAFRESGADRYLLKHETINPELYRRLHPGQSLKNRLRILDYLRKIGYQVGPGSIIGLPGQTISDLADDILFFQSFQPDMIGIGPFIPQKDTPLKDHPSPPLGLILNFIALARLVTQNSHIPATTALATLGKEAGEIAALKAGANVIMVNLTPHAYQKDYLIYDNKARIGLKQARAAIKDAGRKISLARGDSLKSG